MEKNVRIIFFLGVLGLSYLLGNNKVYAETGSFIKNYPLFVDHPISQIIISGKGELLGENSFVRAVLVTKDKTEYLIYENYWLLTESGRFDFNKECEETCFLDNIEPEYIRIEGEAAELKIEKSETEEGRAGRAGEPSFAPQSGASEGERKREKDLEKIEKLNRELLKKGKKWKAGETSVSKLTYTEKKKIFKGESGAGKENLPNLGGFEYYSGGVFTLPKEQIAQITAVSFLPKTWDFRNLHNENWMTGIRDQGTADNDWIFSSIGAVEGLINLYSNQHLNIDLSEQNFADCANDYDPVLGMNSSLFPDCTDNNYCFPGSDFCIFKNRGLVEEACSPYAGRDIYMARCTKNTVCSDWQKKIWKISDFYDLKFESDMGTPYCPKQSLQVTEEELKKALIRGGPMNSQLETLGYNLTLIGYETDTTDQATVWIFKASLGTGFGEGGYVRIKTGLSDMGYASLPKGPIIAPEGIILGIVCADKDNDTYCNWGISEEKPASCPANCRAEKDCNDSNPNLGSFDENYNCTQITNSPTLKTGWNRVLWTGFTESLLAINCGQYEWKEIQWLGKSVGYGLPLNVSRSGKVNILCR